MSLFSLFKKKTQVQPVDPLVQKREDSLVALKINYPINSRCILIPNGPAERITVATVVGYDYHNENSREYFPLFQVDGGPVFATFAKIIPYDENRYEALMKLAWWERWNVVTSFGPSLNAQEALNLENDRPAWDDGEESR